MTKRNIWILIGLVFLIASGGTYQAQANQSMEVKVIYFVPQGEETKDAEAVEWMKEAQDFYRAEMVKHGFGEKTFRLNPDVLVVKGAHEVQHYAVQPVRAVRDELEGVFADKNRIYVVFVAGASLIGNAWGWGWVFHLWGTHGGAAVVAENAPAPDGQPFRPQRGIVSLIHHEMNHAFGIQHIRFNEADFQKAKYRWLDKHLAFNDVQPMFDVHPKARSLGTEGVLTETNVKYVRFTISVDSLHGLNQAMLWRRNDWQIVGWSDEIPENVRDVVIDIRLWKVQDSQMLMVDLMDIHGNRRTDEMAFTIPEFPKEDPASVDSSPAVTLTWAELKM